MTIKYLLLVLLLFRFLLDQVIFLLNLLLYSHFFSHIVLSLLPFSFFLFGFLFFNLLSQDLLHLLLLLLPFLILIITFIPSNFGSMRSTRSLRRLLLLRCSHRIIKGLLLFRHSSSYVLVLLVLSSSSKRLVGLVIALV